jgi:hypothetical protein
MLLEQLGCGGLERIVALLLRNLGTLLLQLDLMVLESALHGVVVASLCGEQLS